MDTAMTNDLMVMLWPAYHISVDNLPLPSQIFTNSTKITQLDERYSGTVVW